MSALATVAQDKVTWREEGNKIHYTLAFYTGGNTIPMTAVVDSSGTEYVKIVRKY